MNVLERGGAYVGASVEVFALGLVLEPGGFGERDNSVGARMFRDEVVHNSYTFGLEGGKLYGMEGLVP